MTNKILSDDEKLELYEYYETKYNNIKKQLEDFGIENEELKGKFEEIYKEMSNNLDEILEGNINRGELNSYKIVNKAIELILSLSKDGINEEIEIKRLDISFFKKGEIKSGLNLDEEEENKEIEIEIKLADKYEKFLKVFDFVFPNKENIIIDVNEEELDKKKMRKVPYKLIYIKTPEFSRTILISDQIGQATFVYDGIIDSTYFKGIKKGEEINGSKPNRIVYGANYSEKLKEQLQVDFEELEYQNKSDKEILIEESNCLLKEEVQEYFKEIKETEEDSYNYWMGLTTKEIGAIEYGGKKIIKLSSILGWKNTMIVNMNTPKRFQLFINWLFGKEIKENEEKNELKEINKEEVQKYFKEIKETEEDSFDYWIGLGVKEILDIEYEGRKIENLSTLSGWKNINDVNIKTYKGFQEFIGWLFGKTLEEIIERNNEKIKKYFKEIRKTEKESCDYFIGLGTKEIREIIYKGKRIKSLSKNLGWENKDGLDISTPKGFHEFIGWLFGKEIKKINKEEVQKYFKEKKSTQEDSYKYWMGLGAKEILTIDYKGKKIISLSKIIFGKELNGLNVQNVKGFKEFINRLF